MGLNMPASVQAGQSFSVSVTFMRPKTRGDNFTAIFPGGTPNTFSVEHPRDFGVPGQSGEGKVDRSTAGVVAPQRAI
jgi:hypothetical protein